MVEPPTNVWDGCGPRGCREHSLKKVSVLLVLFVVKFKELSAPSPGDDLRSKSAIHLRRRTVHSDSFWGIGCDFSAATIRFAVAMHFAMKNGQICFSLRKSLAISLAIQKITSDCGCDAVVL